MTAADRDNATLRALAECLAVPVPADTGDEHQRWPLYQRAIHHGTCLPRLLAAVAVDPDDALVSAVVVQMMEQVDAAGREQWIALARNDHDRRYASRRGHEVDILRTRGAIAELGPDTVSGWTDWLQLRLAETATVAGTLDHLARHGRTKRIRRTAADRLAAL